MYEPNDHIERLNTAFEELSSTLKEIADGSAVVEMMRLVRFPGYTTPAEMVMTQALVDDIKSHAKAIIATRQALLNGVRLVGQSAAEV
jgi:hypothetical protein